MWNRRGRRGLGLSLNAPDTRRARSCRRTRCSSPPLCVAPPSGCCRCWRAPRDESALAMHEASDRERARPAHVTGHRPRMSARCASARESLRSIPAADPPRQRLDRRERRSARHGAGRRYVGRAPTASGRDHRQAGRDRLIPAVPRVARTSPRARRPPNQRRPGVPLANPHGANRNAQRETGPTRPLAPQLQAQTHKHPGASVRHRPPGRLALRWRVAALTAAACVVHHRSPHRTRPEGLDHSDQRPRRSRCRRSDRAPRPPSEDKSSRRGHRPSAGARVRLGQRDRTGEIVVRSPMRHSLEGV